MIKYFIYKQGETECNECFFINLNDHDIICNLSVIKYAWERIYYYRDEEVSFKNGKVEGMEGSVLYSGLILLREHLKKETSINNTIDNLLK